jgi:hypothetical protein
MDFTMVLKVAAIFACLGRERQRWGRIAVLDVEKARDASQIIDLRAFSATRAARQKAFGVYVPGHDNLCDLRRQRQLGVLWYRFRRDRDDEMQWQKRSAGLLRTTNDRLAGWVRHAVSVYARRVTPVSRRAAQYLLKRVPLLPLVAELRTGGIGFQKPTSIPFLSQVETARTFRDWQRHRRRPQPDSRFTVYRRIPGTRLVRFVGT